MSSRSSPVRLRHPGDEATSVSRILQVAATLSSRNETLATVECTIAGALGAMLTDVPGASAWYAGGVVPYSARAKEVLLGLPPSAFGGHGTVSPEAAALLATSVRERLGSDWALAETGLTGPRGAHRSAKEPGTAYLCLLGPDGPRLAREIQTGLDDRAANKRAFLDAALALLAEGISTNFEAAV